MADWEEIKRLAADFQRAQLSSTVQRLSERNCVEIVRKLIDLKLLDVIYTTDGKEYLTPQELGKEIREELAVRGGRINLVDLQQALNVDFSHIETKVNEISKNDRTLTLILGQLIDKSYLDTLAEDINDRLQEQGQVTIAELAKFYDLPGDFLSETIDERLKTVIKGHRDDFNRDAIFTEAFVSRHRAKVRGAFSAITRPTTLMTVIHRYGLQERMFYMLLDELVATGRLAGTVSGGHQDKAQYVPDLYARSQHDWVDNFYQQNGYLEYDALVRLGISDPKTFIKKRLKGEPLLYLGSCCLGQVMVDQAEAEVDEALSSGGWVDVLPLLPSICSPADAGQLLQRLMKGKVGAHVFCESIVASERFLHGCRKSFTDVLHKKAEEVARTNPGLLSGDRPLQRPLVEDSKEDRKDQRRKKASAGGKGGGTQGRESKTKSTKKKGPRGRDLDDSDDENAGAKSSGRSHQVELEFMSVEQLSATLREAPGHGECPEEFLDEIASSLQRSLNKEFTEASKSIFLQSVGASSGAGRKKTHGELSEKVNGLWANAQMFEKGIKCFNDDVQSVLTKHLLKTICTDMTNQVVGALAADHMMSVEDESTLTHEARLKIYAKLPDDKSRALLAKLEGSLSGKELGEFYGYFESVCGSDHIGVSLKKPDKKKERQLVFTHRQALLEQLRCEVTPAMALHLAAVVLFQVFTSHMVHAPGRAVPDLVAFLQPNLPSDSHTLLTDYQHLVMRKMKLQNDKSEGSADPDCADASRQLEELLPKVKDIALTAKKATASQSTED